MANGLKKVKGSNHSYTEIGKRGNIRIAFSLLYAPHPETGEGFLLTRFVAYNAPGEAAENPQFNHFMVRDLANLKYEDDGAQLKAIRLNRNAIPLFSAGVGLGEVRERGEELMVWGVIAGWIEEQLKAEEFESLVPDMTEFVRSHFPKKDEPGAIKLLLELPDFKTDKELAKAANAKQNPFIN